MGPGQLVPVAASSDPLFSCRHVMLPADIAKLVPKTHLMTETEWRNLGVQQSPGWTHYMVHSPEPHILLFRRPLPSKQGWVGDGFCGSDSQWCERQLRCCLWWVFSCFAEELLEVLPHATRYIVPSCENLLICTITMIKCNEGNSYLKATSLTLTGSLACRIQMVVFSYFMKITNANHAVNICSHCWTPSSCSVI